MTESEIKRQVVPLSDIKANLLEVRNTTHFNIGSPQAIDHLLVTLLLIIDNLAARFPEEPQS